jgi:DNA-binding NarL/FixJ family response regulator
MIRVLVADDQALVRGGFRVLVASESDMEVVGEASDGAEAIALARATSPDVVLMDIRMPGIDGLEATRVICGPDGVPGARVIILTTFDLDEYVFEALRAGASGFLLKDTEPSELLNAVRVVAEGEALLAPSVTRRLIAEFVRHPDPHATAPEALEAARRPGTHERRDREGPLHQPGHGEDARLEDHVEARRPRPGPARRGRLRVGTGGATQGLTGEPGRGCRLAFPARAYTPRRTRESLPEGDAPPSAGG